jgi:hypothetical protein
MQSTSGTWHFITPDGTVYRWTGAPAGADFLSNSVPIAILDGTFYADPARLHDAPLPQGGDTGGSSVTVARHELVVTFGDGFVGDLPIVVHWSDGIATGKEHVTVTVTNSLPELGLTDQQVDAGADLIVIDLPAVDADGDALEYAATIHVHDPLARLAFDLDQQLGLRFTGNYSQNWGGANERWLQSAGNTWYFITPEGALYRWTGARPGASFISGSVLVATFDGTYHAEPDRLHAAPSPTSGDLRGSSVEIINGSTLVVTIGDEFAGELRVVVAVADGIDSEADEFFVRVLSADEQQSLDTAFAAWDGPLL